MSALKILFFRTYFNLALSTDPNTSVWDRIITFFLSILTLGPVVFVMDGLHKWFSDYQGFTIGVLLFIMLNMLLGSYVHYRKGDFEWILLLRKTNKMVLVLLVSYFTLEVLISIVGTNIVVDSFRIAIQVSTLLYPASKILKNIFIISEGEHPPKWVMQKIYNFQENGDLQELFDKTKD